MSWKKIIAVLLVGGNLLGLCSCAVGDEGKTFSTQDGIASSENVITKQEIEENSIHIRDKNLLYENQDNTEIVTMYLTVSSGNPAEGTDHTWEEINTYSVYDYERMGVDRYKVAGLLQVGDENGLVPGELGYDQVSSNCTVQIRGQSSSLSTQKNYKIKLKDNKGDWRGQTTIALNKHQSEGLRFRNKMAFDMMSDIDQIMSLQTTFVHLYVKDTTKSETAAFEDYGIYTQVEQLNKSALERHGLDKRGHLYKVNDCEFYRYEDVIRLADDPEYNLEKFEEILEVKGDEDHTKLITLLDEINDYEISIEEILEKHFDVENIAYWMAFNILVGNVDSQCRNFYLYSPQNIERWYIYPWDLDGMLQRKEYQYKGRVDYESWESGVSNYWGNVLFQRCLKSEWFREELDHAVTELYEKFTEEYIMSYANTYANLLKPLVYSGKDLNYAPLTQTEYDDIVNHIPAEIAENYERYLDSLEKPMPFYIGMPYKTESGYTIEWDPSYDFDQEDITYTFELATDYNFEQPLLVKEGLLIPAIDISTLEEGQYFMRVTAKNKSGETQQAFDYYHIENGKIYGTKCFYVGGDGTVWEDVYED